MGLYINTTTMKLSQVYNIFMTLALFTLWPSNSALRCTAKWNECVRTFKAILFIIAPKWKPSKCLSIAKHTAYGLHKRKLSTSKLKKNNYYKHTAGWISQTMMSRRSQIQQTSHCTIPFIWGLRTAKRNLQILTGRGTKGAFWDDGNVLHLELSHVYMNTTNSLSCTLRFSHFKLHSNSRQTECG